MMSDEFMASLSEDIRSKVAQAQKELRETSIKEIREELRAIKLYLIGIEELRYRLFVKVTDKLEKEGEEGEGETVGYDLFENSVESNMFWYNRGKEVAELTAKEAQLSVRLRELLDE